MIYINSCLSTDIDLHNGEQPTLCKFCDKTFSDESYLTDHMGIHRDCNPISYRYILKRNYVNLLVVTNMLYIKMIH